MPPWGPGTQPRQVYPNPSLCLGIDGRLVALAWPFAQHFCSPPGHLALKSAMPPSTGKHLGITRALADDFFSDGVKQEAGLDRRWGRKRRSSPTLALVAVLICRDCAPDDASSVFPGWYNCTAHPDFSLAPPARPHPAGGPRCLWGCLCHPGLVLQGSSPLRGHPVRINFLVHINFLVQNQAGCSLGWISRNKFPPILRVGLWYWGQLISRLASSREGLEATWQLLR